MNSDKEPSLNWFLIDQEIPVREMVEFSDSELDGRSKLWRKSK